jgi:hypothetical protein
VPQADALLVPGPAVEAEATRARFCQMQVARYGSPF